MERRLAVSYAVAFVALSLLLSPVLMADFHEKATAHVEPIEREDLQDGTPILQFSELPPDARGFVRQAIESPDGTAAIYGTADWPDRFFYSDYTAPGHGLYGIRYDGSLYELSTSTPGAFPIVTVIYSLPFVVFGLLLVAVASLTYRGRLSTTTASLGAVGGLAPHLLGPGFDFPVLTSGQLFVAGGLADALVAAVLVVGLLTSRFRQGS